MNQVDEKQPVDSEPRGGARVYAVVVLLSSIQFVLLLHTIHRTEATVDEVGHLPAGISYVQKGTFGLYHHNPPLIKMMAACASLQLDPVVDYSGSWDRDRLAGRPPSPWAFGWEFMYANKEKFHDIYTSARLVVAALSVLTGVFLFIWSRRLFGDFSALMALTLWTLSPTVLAHSSVITTDIGATGIGFIATFFFWLNLRRPSWPRTTFAGTLLGVAQLAKFSSLLLYPLWGVIIVLSYAVTPMEQRRGSIGRRLGEYSLMVALSIVVINCGYLFEQTGKPLGEFRFLSRALTVDREKPIGVPVALRNHPLSSVYQARENRFAGTVLGHIPVPFPFHYVAGFDEQKFEAEGGMVKGGGYPVYLMGHMRRTGWWWYYVVALLIKVPLGTWVLTVMAAASLWRVRSCRASLSDEIVLFVPPLVMLFVMTFLTDINLGVRYILPVFPFWFLGLSRLGSVVGTNRVKTAIIGLALLANVLAVRHHPNHMAYFNELVGGPENGGEYLIDSNLDWGQGLVQLAEWVRENRPGETVQLAYFGNVDPAILEARGLGFNYVLAPPRSPEHLELLALSKDSILREEIAAWENVHRAELNEWVNTHPGEQLTSSPLFAELKRDLLQMLGISGEPGKGLYAVSANLVYGLPFRVRDQEGNLWNARGDDRLPESAGAYSYLASETPIARVGNSIYIYEL